MIDDLLNYPYLNGENCQRFKKWLKAVTEATNVDEWFWKDRWSVAEELKKILDLLNYHYKSLCEDVFVSHSDLQQRVVPDLIKFAGSGACRNVSAKACVEPGTRFPRQPPYCEHFLLAIALQQD